MADPAPSRKSGVPAVRRAAAVLEALADATPGVLGASELARRLGIPKSSVLNLRNSPVEVGFTSRRHRWFGPGAKFVELGSAYLSSIDLVHEFCEVCAEVDVTTVETIQLAVLADEFDVVYLARRRGRHPATPVSDIGRHLPANGTATGEALLAPLSPADHQSGRPRERACACSATRSATPRRLPACCASGQPCPPARRMGRPRSALRW